MRPLADELRAKKTLILRKANGEARELERGKYLYVSAASSNNPVSAPVDQAAISLEAEGPANDDSSGICA